MTKQFSVTAPVLALTFVLSYTAAAGAAPRKAAAPAAQTVQAEERAYTIEELKLMAAACRKSNDAEGLVSALQKWAAQDTKRFDIRLELGAALMSQEKFGEAVQVLKQASAIIPSDEAPHSLMAKIYAAAGNENLRAEHLAQAARLAPRNWENQFNLAAYYISAGKKAEAEKLLAKTMELNAAFAPAKFEYAKLMLNKKDLESAFRKFDEALLIEPENALYQAYYAYTAAISGRMTIASEYISAAVKGAPTNSEVLGLAAKVMLSNRNNTAAEQSARAALRYSPTDMRALETLADVFAANFKYKEAVGSYMTVWQNAGYSDELAYKIGVALSLDGKFREAKDFFAAVAVKYPNNGELLYRLTEVYCELGDIKQANALLMLNRFGNSKENLVWHKASQGKIHEAQNNADLALIAYLAAHTVSDKNAHVNLALGRLYFKQTDFHSAIAYLNAANALDPVNMQPLVLKAKAYQELGNYGDAIGIYEQILGRNPKLAEISLSIAYIKEELGDVNGAIKTLNNGLAFNPKDANLLFQLGRLYQTTKQYELAINAYQSSIGRKANSHNVESLRMIGEIYYTKLTNEKKAVEYFKKYVKAGGKDNNVDYLIKKINGKG